MDKRTLIAVVLSIAVLFIYQNFFAPKPAQQPAPAKQEAALAPQAVQQPPAAAEKAAPAPAVRQAVTGRMVAA
ncbi:MAG: protein translocase component YidC, partial [Proteobacteria bacterium]|nr:protein translocase component YidC [Pseudomonadota bacterium]